MQLSLKSLSFNYLTTPSKESGFSSLQSACIKGDVDTVLAILNLSPDKLDSAIALSAKIGPNAPHFPGKSILTVLKHQDTEKHKEILETVSKVTEHFQSQSLLHLAAKKGNVEHVRRLLDAGEPVDAMCSCSDQLENKKTPWMFAVRCSCSDRREDEKTPLMFAAEFNEVEVVEFLIERGASLEMTDSRSMTPFLHAVSGGKMQNAKRLFELGANVLKETRRGMSAIHVAAGQGNKDAVFFLLEHGASADQQGFYGLTPLMLAARKGCLDTVKLLLSKGANLNGCSQGGETPLLFAAKENHTDLVKFLLKKGANLFAIKETVLHFATQLDLVSFLCDQGANIHANDSWGKTPLHAAAKNGQSDTVRFLLERGADINSSDDRGHTALYYAILAEHASTAKVLIESGCEVKLILKGGHFVDEGEVLEAAARKGFSGILKLLLDKGVPVDAVSRYETPLIVAARAGHCEVVNVLLDHGANINGFRFRNFKSEKHEIVYDKDRDSEDSDNKKEETKLANTKTPLYCALVAGRGEVARLLIERGADTSDPSGNTSSLSELAATRGLSDVFRLLTKEKSFDFNKIKDDGETLLTSAATSGKFDSVKFLLDNGAEVNVKNASGDTALSCAVQSCAVPDLEIVRLLLAHGAAVNTRNDHCETPLLIAATWNADKVANLLIEHGCDTTSKNLGSFSALHSAANYNNGKLIEKLLQHGAVLNLQTDDEGMTPLHVAAKSGSVLAADVLLEHGADLESTTRLVETPLLLAAQEKKFAMLYFLTEKGSNVDAKNGFGKTVLMNLAIGYEGLKTFSLAKTLLQLGSSVNATDEFGRSVLHYMSCGGNSEREFYNLLLSHGGNVNLPDRNVETPLHFAASDGNTALIEWLLEQGADVRALDRKNRSPLHSAAYRGCSISVQLLIQNGADVHLADKKGWLPLHLAAVGGHRTTFEVLLQNGSDVTLVDRKGRTCLHLVAKYGPCAWEELFELLNIHGGNINAKDFSGQTVFGASLTPKKYIDEHHFFTRFLQLYMENGGDVHAVDLVTGQTTLHVAAACSLTDIADNLLDEGLNLEARDKNGDTPLHRASAQGTLDMIQGLVEKGADPSAVNKRGQTPLLVCVALNFSTEGSTVLIENGSDVNTADNSGNTALYYAVRRGHVFLDMLIKNGADVNAVNAIGCTPLHVTAGKIQSVEAINVLLSAGGDVHCRDKQGNTPLHLAVAEGHYYAAGLLIEKGSDVYATNLKGETCAHMMLFPPRGMVKEAIVCTGQVNAVDNLGSSPLHLALLSGRWPVARCLLKHGSDPNAVDYKGSTPLHVGCSSGSKSAVSFLIDHGG